MVAIENEPEKDGTNEPARISPLGMAVRLLLPIIVLAAGIGGYSLLAAAPPEEEAPPPEPQVIRTRVAELAVQDYPVMIESNGTVQSHNEIALSAQVSGQITRISESFEVGAYFSEGEVLVELDPRDYRTSVTLAEAELQSTQAALELAQLNHERMQEGAPQTGVGVVTRAEVEQARSALMQAEAVVEAAKAELEQAKLDLERTEVRAPFGGRVRSKNVGLGQSVSAGTALATVYADDYAEVRLPIARSDLRYLTLPELETDAPVDVRLRDAISPDDDTIWQAKIVRTEGALDVDSLELYAIARVDDPFGLESSRPPLRIGQPVVATIRGATLNDVIAIPRQAVRELDQIVLVDEAAMTLSTLTIDPVWADADHVVVRYDPIYEGTLLATSHIVYVPEGATVEIIPEAPLETDS